MTILNYKFERNADGYLVGFVENNEDYEFTGQMSEHPNATKGYTKYSNGQFIADEAKKAEILAEETKQARIAELKQYLNDTDYIWNSIREGGRTEEYYADVIAKRKAYRKEIQELEG